MYVHDVLPSQWLKYVHMYIVLMTQEQTTLNLDVEIKAKFKDFCYDHKITMSELIERLIRVHLKTHHIKVKDSKK